MVLNYQPSALKKNNVGFYGLTSGLCICIAQTDYKIFGHEWNMYKNYAIKRCINSSLQVTQFNCR